MTNDADKNQIPARTVAEALDESLNHIASAHGLIDRVRKSAQTQKGDEPKYLQRDIGRVWHALDIAGVLLTQLSRRLQQQESQDKDRSSSSAG